MGDESITKLIKPGHEIINEYQKMRVKDLKHILERLPDDMAVIIPVIDEEDANHISGFRHVGTAGVLISEGEQDREALCLNSASDGQDIADQVYFSGRDVGVKNVLFGTSKFENLSETDKRSIRKKEVLILKTKVYMPKDELKKVHDILVDQLKSGVVIIPAYFDAKILNVPENIEVIVEAKEEKYRERR